MTLPDFAYPDQHRYGIPNYAERLARRILDDLEQETYLPILDQTIPPAEDRAF
jgi:hypothetical protein